MRTTGTLLQAAARLTLFTRANCSLCDKAKNTVAEIRARRKVDYFEIDVMTEGQQQWKDMYEFDTPVLHVQGIKHPDPKPDLQLEAKKLWHRFSTEEVEQLINEAEGASK